MDGTSEGLDTTDTYDVTVALVGRPWDPDPHAIDDDLVRPYEDRPKVVVSADPSDSLRAVLAEATALFQRAHPGDYTDAGRSLAFYQGDPREPVHLHIPATTTLTITSEDGLAVWHVAPEDASMGDLVLAEQRKVFRGDPLRPYLVVDPKWQMAGATPGGWDTFIQVWDVLVYIAGSISVLKTGHKISKRGLELLSRATDAWTRHRKVDQFTRRGFEERNADIMDVIETARAAATYQIADIMAWTGIEDPAIAADVAGWAGSRLDEASGSLSIDPDEDYVGLVRDLPIGLSMDLPLELGSEQAHEEVTNALAEALLDRGLVEGE
jgi:hypothetical protein